MGIYARSGIDRGQLGKRGANAGVGGQGQKGPVDDGDATTLTDANDQSGRDGNPAVADVVAYSDNTQQAQRACCLLVRIDS